MSGATGYDVRSSADGSSWTTEHSNVSATSASVANADNAIEYIGVRAINASAASAWTELSRSPSNEMLNTATGVNASGGLVMAAAQSEGASAQAQSQLGAPTWGTITRSTHGRMQAALDLNWTAVTNATGYNIVCSDTGGWTWGTCGWLNGSTTTYTSVPSTQTKPVKVTHYRSGSNS